MIATVSPGALSVDHSLNTLRYADRIKEKRVRKSPRRSISAISTNRPLSISPRRPVDATNHQSPILRTNTVNTKPAALNKPTTRPTTRASIAETAGVRMTRSMSARVGLQHSNSLQTASSMDSRISYKSAPNSGNSELRSDPGRSFSAASSVDEELDSLLDDNFDLNLSIDSGLVDPPAVSNSVSSGIRGDTLFEPQPMRSSLRGDENSQVAAPPTILSEQSGESLSMNLQGASRRNGSRNIEQVEDQRSISLNGDMGALQDLHMEMITEYSDLMMRDQKILDALNRSENTEQDVDQYVLELERIVRHRIKLISKFDEHVAKYHRDREPS